MFWLRPKLGKYTVTPSTQPLTNKKPTATTLISPIHCFQPSSWCIPAHCYPPPLHDIGWLLVSGARLWMCKRNKVLFVSQMFSVPLHLAVLLFAHCVLFDFMLGALILTLFPCHSTWLCEVVDLHRQTDVLFSLFVHGLSHHISPFVDCCLLFCCLLIVFDGFLHSNTHCLNEGTFLHSNASVWL